MSKESGLQGQNTTRKMTPAERFQQQINKQARKALDEQEVVAATRGMVISKVRQTRGAKPNDDVTISSSKVMKNEDEEACVRGLVKKRVAYHVRQQSTEEIPVGSPEVDESLICSEEQSEDIGSLTGLVQRRVMSHKRRGSGDCVIEGPSPASEEEQDFAGMKGFVKGLVEKFNAGEVSNTEEEEGP